MSCPTCQNFFQPSSRFEQLATSGPRQGTLFRCKDCDSLFERIAGEPSVRFTSPDELSRYYPDAHAAMRAVKERLLSLAPAELRAALAPLSPVQLRGFACDCAEHVLPFFERLLPQDQRPRQTIATARRFARGEVDAATLALAVAQAEGAAWAAAELAGTRGEEGTEAVPAENAAASAAAAAQACCAPDAHAAALAAASSAVEVVLIAALGAQRADHVWAWQWHFATYDPAQLRDAAALAGKAGPELLDQYQQAQKPEHEWQLARVRVYRDTAFSG